MSSVWISRRGAGGSLSGAWAVLRVTCPTGSRCTVSRDGVVLHDLSRDGVSFFAVPSAGEWRVAISDGERERSTTVAITERGEMAHVLLRYTEDSLFAPGSGSESLWVTSGAASAGSESIVLTANAENMQAIACLKEPVSLAGASALMVSAEQTIVKLGSVPEGELTPTGIYIIPEDTAATDVAHAVRSLAVGEGSFTGQSACLLDVSGLDADKRFYVTIRSQVRDWSGGTTLEAVACRFTITGVSVT